MYGKLLDRNRKRVDERLDDMLKAQRHAVDRIVQRYRRLGAVLLDPDVGDDELREDQSDLGELDARRPEAPLRADGRASRRPEPVRRAFLSRMKFVDEQGEGASPDAGGATGLPRTPRGGAPRPAARCVDRLRPTGAAAVTSVTVTEIHAGFVIDAVNRQDRNMLHSEKVTTRCCG